MALGITFQPGEHENVRRPKLNSLVAAADAATAVTSDPTIVALAALDTTPGLVTQTGTDTFTKRTLATPAAGITISNPAGTAGNPTFALANDLAAIEALSGTGIVSHDGTDSFVLRTLTGTANEVTVTNGAGILGNPTFSLPTALTFTGKTVTGGVFSSLAGISFQNDISLSLVIPRYDNSSFPNSYVDAASASGALILRSPNLTGSTMEIANAGYKMTVASLGNYLNDAAAAIGGVAVGGLYRNGSALMIRVA